MTMRHAFLLPLLLFTIQAKANICGTDFQNFNPTTNGLDFVTVHSSETLKPCIINTGFFLNYAYNSLTYSKDITGVSTGGRKRQDRILGADASIGMGINERWDFGISFPMILDQQIKDNNAVATYDNAGLTEIRGNTKYRFSGDETGGFAGILSMNQNLIQNNPFAGSGSNPTWNLELAADTTLASRWAIGANIGYRRRDQGKPIPNVPFVPMDDQWIYSAAGSYLFPKYDSKLILELYGSTPAKAVEKNTARALSSLEALAGVKYDYSQSLAMHFGLTKQVQTNLGGADWRVYAGMNWAFGPVCKTSPMITWVSRGSSPEVFNLNVELLFANNSDEISPGYEAMLDNFIKELIKEGFDRVLIEGHTDSRGSPDYNMDLSLRRANKVRMRMIEKHNVPAKKLESQGYGLKRPIADNGNYQGRQRNRRVEFKVWRDKGR